MMETQQQGLTKWLSKELSRLLDCEIGDDYSKSILKIETEPEINEFIGSLLDLDIDANRRFYTELITRLKKQLPKTTPELIVYRKPDLDEGSKTSKSRNKNQAKEIDHERKQRNETSQKLVANITAKSSERNSCICQAAKHKLIGNCLKCGRIVCEQEGSGPCYFCGNLVCTKEEYDKIRSGSNKGNHLRDELMKKGWAGLEMEAEEQQDSSRQRAIEHKDKLLDFDRTSAKRTQVIDDESDYFNTNSKWLNSEQREKLEKKQAEIREKRFGSKLGKTFTLDFAGRKVIDEQTTVDLAQHAQQIEDILTEKPAHTQQTTVANQDIRGPVPQFIDDKPARRKANKENLMAENSFRLQDSSLQEMRDDGMCLSMHQPWASLLVLGIKKHEGRSWYSAHRGRLWIHAAAKQPDECEIKEMENFYRAFYSNQNIRFPESYPTSCLLGFVNVTDCLPADVYKEEFPSGESESEFVFICNNFRELVTKLPMSGDHKIFKLDKSVHQVAKKTSIRYHEDV